MPLINRTDKWEDIVTDKEADRQTDLWKKWRTEGGNQNSHDRHLILKDIFNSFVFLQLFWDFCFSATILRCSNYARKRIALKTRQNHLGKFKYITWNKNQVFLSSCTSWKPVEKTFFPSGYIKIWKNDWSKNDLLLKMSHNFWNAHTSLLFKYSINSDFWNFANWLTLKVLWLPTSYPQKELRW